MRKLQALINRLVTVRPISAEGLKFIADFEGFPNGGRPYNDPVGYATVGYGHLIGYRRVSPGDHEAIWVPDQRRPGRLTMPEARRLLRIDLRKEYERPVRALFERGGPLHGQFSQHRLDALVSFVYNLGPGSIAGAPGFETMRRAILAGDIAAIGDAMLLYDKAGGRALPGLTRRRRCERRLFLTGNYSTTI